MPVADFTWHDGGRVVRFGRGALAEAADLLGDDVILLTTERAAATAPDVVASARAVIHVAPGDVGALSAELLPRIGDAAVLGALGGGRVIDTAKAIASVHAARPRVGAVPTTLSAAEMTATHRLPEGAPAGTRPVRPALVVNDPALCASQPGPELAASAANSLAHAAEGSVTRRASPVPTLAGHEAVRLITEAYGVEGEPDRDALALAALLSGYAIDGNGYGLHHVMSQTARAVGGAGHGQANAAMLPHTARALAERAGDRLPAGVLPLAEELARRAGAERLRDAGVPEDALGRCAAAAAGRSDLDNTPPRAGEAELRALYEAAW